MGKILTLNEMAYVKDIDELRIALRTNICEFVYTKKDGTRRTAFGTTSKDFIVAAGGTVPAGDATHDSAYDARREGLKNAGYISYFDLEKKGWRNCKTYNSEDVDLLAKYASVEELKEAHPALEI